MSDPILNIVAFRKLLKRMAADGRIDARPKDVRSDDDKRGK